MASTTDFAEFQAAASRLRSNQGRVLGIFFALRFRRIGIPRVTDLLHKGMGVTEVEARILSFYTKRHSALAANDGKYWKPFQGFEFGNQSADNQFRDSIKWKSGTACCAPLSEVSTPAFLATNRTTCPHHTLSTTGRHGCAIMNDEYMQGRDRTDWPRLFYWDKDKSTDNYFALDLWSPEVLASIRGAIARLDPADLLTCIYFGAPWHDASDVDLSRFAADFGFATINDLYRFFGRSGAEDQGPRVDPVVSQAIRPPRQKAVSDAVGQRFLTLTRYGNLILEGVPGTGKTEAFLDLFSAWDSLAERYSWPRRRAAGGSPAVFTMHPSTGYEDFVEGLRPAHGNSVDTGWFWGRTAPDDPSATKWSFQDGFFLRACQRAVSDPEHDHLILLDELNRTNVPKVMGDLLTTLEAGRRVPHRAGEWRVSEGLHVSLPYSNRRFFVPENLFVVATLNTSDRSVATLDSALRRRFAFERLEPLEPAALLAELEAARASAWGRDADAWRDAAWARVVESANLWGRLNTALRASVGPDGMLGHSYIFGLSARVLVVGVRPAETRGSADDIVRQTWRQEILPQLVDGVAMAGREEELFSDSSQGGSTSLVALLKDAPWLSSTGRFRLGVVGDGLLARTAFEELPASGHPGEEPSPGRT